MDNCQLRHDMLHMNMANGKVAMPAKGGQPSISDEVIKATVDYMVSNSSKL